MNRTTRLCLLMANIFAGCGDGRDYGMYTDVLEEIDLRGHGGTTSIVSALNSSDPYLQKLAVEGLGRFESKEHIVQIADVLDSRDSEVRQSAVNALGQSVFRTDGDEVSDILLKHLLIEENGVVRGTIARTLGRLSLSEKNKTKLEVFKLTANTVPNTTPIATNTPKVLTILKSTALNFMCVIVDIIDVGIIIEKEVPKARCITKVCSMPAKLNK